MRTASSLLKILVISCVCFMSTSGYAQEASNPGAFKTLRISEWSGERFIFLPRKKSLQQYGYQLIHKRGNRYGSLPYDKYVGRMAKVTKVMPSGTGVSGAWVVSLVMEETGEELTAEAVSSKVEGLAPVRDIESAKAAYKNKTLWLKEQLIQRYEPEQAKESFIGLDSIPAPVEVVDIVPGVDHNSPVRFVLKVPSGASGFVDVSLSGTNADESLRSFHLFDKYFMTAASTGNTPKAPGVLPSGKYKITTKYDRFTDMTEAVLQETLARTGEGVHGLTLTAVATFKGTQVNENPTFTIYLSSTDTNSHTSPLRYEEAEILLLLADSERLSLTIKNYKYNRSPVMGWTSEYASAELKGRDVERLIRAKTVEGRWGNTEFRFREEALEAFREFVSRLKIEVTP